VSHGYNIGLVPEPEQQLGLHGGRGLDQYPWLLIGGSSVFITEIISKARRGRDAENVPRPLALAANEK